MASIVQIKSSLEMVIKLPEGTGGALLIGMEIDEELASTPTGLWFTYDIAIMENLTPVNSATTGAMTLQINGANYGFSDSSIKIKTGGSM